MRTTFFLTVEKYYKKDKNVFVLTADLGFKLFDSIKNISPNRFYNMGIAEANMIGTSAGIALTGGKVYCYSIIPFLVMRAYEQIRVDIDYHDLDVKMVGMGSGFSYGLEGITHFGLEDIALMRSLQNVAVVVPADMREAACFADISYNHKGPMFIRMGSTNAPFVYTKKPAIKMGKAVFLKEGKHAVIFAVGDMVHNSLRAADILAGKGIKTTVVNMHTIKPLDAEAVKSMAQKHDFIFTVEEHNISGGLGSAVAEVISEAGICRVFKRIGIPSKLKNVIGRADHLRKFYGLYPEGIAGAILKEMKQKNKEA
ncbi:MAG: transketolase C-terminal domain-containing protein, partial [Candidatus Omnitrophota bacterium]